MKPLRLFVHLIKFHVLSVPWTAWLVVLGLSVFLGGLQWTLSGRAGMDMGDNLFSLVYFFILAAQMWGVRGVPAGRNAQNWTTGLRDFLWTRPVDRGVLFWSKLAVFAAVCSLVWIDSSAPRIFRTEPVRVTLNDDSAGRTFGRALLDAPAFAARVEASASPQASREVIALDRGNVVLAGFGAWKVAAISLVILWFVGALRLNWRWLLGIFFTFLFGWVALMFGVDSLKNAAWLEGLEYRHQVLLYARASLWWWLGLALAGAAIVADTWRRFLRPA